MGCVSWEVGDGLSSVPLNSEFREVYLAGLFGALDDENHKTARRRVQPTKTNFRAPHTEMLQRATAVFFPWMATVVAPTTRHRSRKYANGQECDRTSR
jgi:hypothetical protein